jgi:hypothetical protein
MFSSTQNSQPQPQPDANATLAQVPALAPVLTVAVSDATSTSASSVTITESMLSASPQSFRKQGGTLKRNMYGKNKVWELFQIYDEKKFTTHAFVYYVKVMLTMVELILLVT